MNLFDDLSDDDKAEVLRKAGVPLLVVSFEHYCVMLYSVGDFFVERYFNFAITSTEIIRAATFRDLDKYLDMINIHEVYHLL